MLNLLSAVIKSLALTLLLSPFFANAADLAVGVDTVVLEDASNVADVADELTATLQNQGFEISVVINHSGAAASVGLELAPNQVIFARPPRFLEKRLLSKSKTIGIDLPLKFHVFETESDIRLSVNTLGYLIDRHQTKVRDIALKITRRLTQQFGTPTPEQRGLITVKSTRSVAETVQALQDAISNNPDARIPLVLDYSEGKGHGYKYYRRSRSNFPVLVVFGNPNAGTPLMQVEPRIGIDLPQKLLVWKDKTNQVNITYNDPRFIAKRFDLEGVDARLDAIANALNNIASAGAGVAPSSD